MRSGTTCRRSSSTEPPARRPGWPTVASATRASSRVRVAATVPGAAYALLQEVVDGDERDRDARPGKRARDLIAELELQPDIDARRACGAVDIGPAVTLTAREREILDCLVDGLSNADIGRKLHISANTAANHVRAILSKSGCANRTEAATWAVRKGLVSN